MMEKPAKKKGTGTKGAKTPSAYKAREAEGKASTPNAQFRKTFGTAKAASRKG